MKTKNTQLIQIAERLTFFRLDEKGLERLLPCLESCKSIVKVKETKQPGLMGKKVRQIKIEFATNNGFKDLEFVIKKSYSRFSDSLFTLDVIYGKDNAGNYGIVGGKIESHALGKTYARFADAEEGISYMDDEQRRAFLYGVKSILNEYSKR